MSVGLELFKDSNRRDITDFAPKISCLLGYCYVGGTVTTSSSFFQIQCDI